MASRAIAVIASLVLFTIGSLVLGFGLLAARAAVWVSGVMLLAVNSVTVYIAWTMIARFHRYATRPFQIQQRLEVRLSNDEEALGLIVVEGPAMLILKTSGPLANFSLRDIQPPCAPARHPHGLTEVEFLIHYPDRWFAVLTARKSGRNMTKGALSTITLEIRGHCRIHQLPEAPQVQAKGFPVVVPPSNDVDPRHL